MGQIDGHNLDLSNAASVEAFSLWYREHYGERLDCLINNAGIHLDLMSQWKEPKLSADGRLWQDTQAWFSESAKHSISEYPTTGD